MFVFLVFNNIKVRTMLLNSRGAMVFIIVLNGSNSSNQSLYQRYWFWVGWLIKVLLKENCKCLSMQNEAMHLYTSVKAAKCRHQAHAISKWHRLFVLCTKSALSLIKHHHKSLYGQVFVLVQTFMLKHTRWEYFF